MEHSLDQLKKENERLRQALLMPAWDLSEEPCSGDVAKTVAEALHVSPSVLNTLFVSAEAMELTEAMELAPSAIHALLAKHLGLA